MEPIISPWIIYIAGIVCGVKTFFAVVSVLLFVIIFVAGIFFDEGSIDDAGIRRLKQIGIACIICISIAILIPDEKTVWMMVGASQITPDNITSAQENLIDFAKQISQAIK
mgnify:CR=1 FL=1